MENLACTGRKCFIGLRLRLMASLTSTLAFGGTVLLVVVVLVGNVLVVKNCFNMSLTKQTSAATATGFLPRV